MRVHMMSFVIFVMAINTNAIAAGRDFFGVGGDSCGRWIEVRKVQNTARHGSWVLGYLSALNLWSVIGRQDVLKATDADAMNRAGFAGGSNS